MYKIRNLFIFTIFTITLLGVTFSVPTVVAQEKVFNPNTPISNIEGELAMPKMVAGQISNPRRGPMAKTWEKIPAEYLNLPEKLAPGQELIKESVMATFDSRTKVVNTTLYPYRVIAYLSVQFGTTWYSCTGWIMGPRLVVTAGHCVYEPGVGGRGWAKQVIVYPGKNGASAPYGSRDGYRLFTVMGWTLGGLSDYDYGAIQTSGSAYTNWFGAHTASSYPGTFTISGYPGDKPRSTQWKMSGAITSFLSNRLYYKIDTSRQSGSPVYHKYNSECCYGVGIHTISSSTTNSATRIIASALNNLVAWKYYTYP